MKTNARRKFIATLLALSLILTGFPGTAVWAQSGGTDQTEKQAAAVSSEQPVSQAQPAQEPEVFQLDADCKLLNYVHAEVFAQNNHVARLKEEETLSSYVFQNRDGSRTAYFLDDNVKFVDADGITKEKDITLVSAKGGYSTRQNNIKLLLPSDPASGIRMEYDGHTVTLIPQGGSLRAAPQLVNNSVRYSGYFGENTSLNYTPTLDGLKEDIVLSTYTGINAFTFTMNTGGLNLYQAGEKYYLAESKLAVERIQLNEIEVYDANLKPCRGTLTVKTVMPGQRYDITVSVSEEYLTDPTTVYPVTIDPSLNISDANGSGAIEDAPIYEGYPNSNFGSYIFNRAGYAGSDYGIGRTVVRLTGLLYNSGYANCDVSYVESVRFYMSEGNGDSSRTVRLHSLSSNYNWTESNVTWNSIGSSYGYAWAYANMSYGNYACFDITELAYEWKLGDINGQCGFLLKGADETSVDTVMLSSEYSSRRPYVVADYWSAEPADPPSMDPEVALNVTTRTMSPEETYTLIPYVTPPGSATVSWSSSNSSVVSVDSSGKITARRLGQATITASVGTDTATCVVTVKIPDGVYYIKNATSGFYLGTSGSIANGTITTLQSRTTTDPQRIFQLWQVTHLENGVCYSIQPLNKTSMMLTSPNSAAEIREISSDDSGTAASTYSKWYLSGNWLDGFLFKANNSGAKYLQPNEDDPSTGTHVITEEYDSAGINVYKYYWDLEQVTGVSGFLLYDGTNFVAGTPPIKYAVKEKSYTLLDFGLHIYTYGENANQTLTWICRNANGDTVSSDIFTAYQEGNTYRIRINAVGTYTVTGTNAFGSKSFHVEVIPLEDGTYYIQSPSSEKHLEYDPDHNASVYQDWICGGSSQKWILTHRGDGTYSIQSAGSTNGNYLGPASSVAEGQSVTCQSTNYGWKIVEDQQTAGNYGILLASDTTLAATLASNSNSSGVGLALNRYNLNDLSFSDEWRLLKEGPDVLLVGILDTSPEAQDHDHTTTISTSIPQFRQKGYDSFHIIISEGISTADLQSALEDAQIFIPRGHGNVTDNGTYILLTPEKKEPEPAPAVILDTSDIYDFSTGTVITDMSNCDLAIFPNCYSAAHPTQSLVHAASLAGADVAAGFAEELACQLISDWFNSFFTYYNPEGTVNEGAQLTVVEALHRASADNEDGGFDSIRVVYR